jgi:methylated-DNA-protein-cysteine methyltransferase-like protein
MRQGYLSAEQGVAWLAGETDPWRTDFVTVGLVTKSDDATHLQQLFRAIKVVIRKIPKGRVATYAQVAELAGIPNGGRIAAACLKTSKPSDQLPWQRVVGKAAALRGRIAIHDPVGAAMQRHLLTTEGVEIGESGLVALDVYGWLVARPKAKRVTAGSVRGASPRRRPRSGSKRRASSSRR